MTSVTKVERTLEQHIDATCNGWRTKFLSLKTRNQVAKRLRAEGMQIRVETARGQQLHPQYIQDYVGDFEVGFGNVDYQLSWKSLYVIEVIR